MLDATGAVYPTDVSASRVQQYRAELRTHVRPLPPLDADKAEFTEAEVAAALGVNPTAVPSLIRRHRLPASGNGKARRYPRATAGALRDPRARGRGVKTSNLYLDAVKASSAWLARDRRAADNPLDHLAGGTVKADRRHDRRPRAAGGHAG